MLFCESLGVDKQDVIGKNVLSFFNSDTHEILLSFFDSLKEQKLSTNSNVFHMTRSGKKDDAVKVSIRAVCLGKHEPELNIIVAMKDMTKSIKLEQQEKLARQQLYRSARLTSIGTLASGTAHEMNNPLAAILGFADAMLHRFSKGENIDKNELIQYLKIVKSETLRCRDVVENLSKFSREYESQSEKISLFDCLHSAITLMNARAHKKGMEIKNNIPTDVIINADAQKIGQVLVNILSNSIDFCEDGSSIVIDMDDVQDINGPVRLKITDTGPGIPEELLPKIFDPFFTTKDVGKGIGLGMSISHTLMKECKGSIDVVSEENAGTTVLLEIPRD
jgi:two-component system NtrC family sensor kinase